MKANIKQFITFLLILLWVYAASSKLLNYEESRRQMLNQVFPNTIGMILVWAVPMVELITTGLLMFHRTRLAGLNASLFLLINFTIYIALIMTGGFGRIPCSCGGIIEEMTWGQHLVFNLSFIALTLVAILSYPQTSHSKKFDLKAEPDNLSPAGEKTSTVIRPGNGKNYNEKLPRIRAPAEDGSSISTPGEAAP